LRVQRSVSSLRRFIGWEDEIQAYFLRSDRAGKAANRHHREVAEKNSVFREAQGDDREGTLHVGVGSCHARFTSG